jgi:PKD repeat protein
MKYIVCVILILMSIVGIGSASLLTADAASELIPTYGTGSAGYTWSTVHDATSSLSVNSLAGGSAASGPSVMSWTDGIKWQYLTRMVMCFDTSALTSSDYISNVELAFYVYSVRDDWGTQVFDIVNAFPEAGCSAGTADYNNFGTTVYNSSSILSLSTGGLNRFTLPTSCINKGGYTYIGFRIDSDVDNSPPTSTKGYYAQVYSKHVAGSLNHLNITYESSYSTPEANITSDVTTGELPLTVNFTDSSIGFSELYPYPEYTIYFGDGDSFTGERQYTGENWFHTYDYEGTYNVTYIVTEDGLSYSDSVTITVSDTSTNYYVQVHGLDTSPISGANVTIWYNGALQDWEGTSAIGKS